MKRTITTPLFVSLLAVSFGCKATSQAVVQVTCKPEFEFEPRPDLIVMTRDGDRMDASARFLVIPHGAERYRIPWGTPPVSRGPVVLSKHETYTFTLDHTGKTVRSVRQGDKLLYEAPK
jgi:hypothetical protein